MPLRTAVAGSSPSQPSQSRSPGGSLRGCPAGRPARPSRRAVRASAPSATRSPRSGRRRRRSRPLPCARPCRRGEAPAPGPPRAARAARRRNVRDRWGFRRGKRPGDRDASGTAWESSGVLGAARSPLHRCSRSTAVAATSTSGPHPKTSTHLARPQCPWPDGRAFSRAGPALRTAGAGRPPPPPALAMRSRAVTSPDEPSSHAGDVQSVGHRTGRAQAYGPRAGESVGPERAP